ncbi:c-type cytochrome [Sphingomonas sp. CJ99]
MENRTNTIAGWVLAGCAAALGLSIASGMVYHGEGSEKQGYPVAEAEPAGGSGGGAAAEPPIAALMQTADVAAGAEVFKKCASCHSINQGGANGIGPNLWAVMGKPHAAVAGFAYSDALKSVGGNWDFEAMNQWLKSPRKYAEGTKMTFAGLAKPEDRANVIAYLNAQGSNLPLPAAPATEEAAPAAEGDAAAAAADAPADAMGNVAP